LINHQLLSSLTGHTDAITGLVFSLDGQKVISSSWDKTIRVWQANTGLPIATFSGHSQVININTTTKVQYGSQTQ
jgi:WD40 repeat protein